MQYIFCNQSRYPVDLRTCNRLDSTPPNYSHKNALVLSNFEIPKAMLPELEENMQALTAPYFLPFDDQGNLLEKGALQNAICGILPF